MEALVIRTLLLAAGCIALGVAYRRRSDLDRMRARADRDLADRAQRRECERDTLRCSDACGPCDVQMPGVTVLKDRERIADLQRFQLGLRREMGQA
jgi:hypothetical protein